MASFDVFRNNAFGLIEMTDALNKVEFQPTWVRSKNLFLPRNPRTRYVMIEERDGVLNIIKTSQRGEPLAQRTKEQRKARSFEAPRIAKQDTLWASEIDGVRAFGSETELQVMQTEVADRLNGPFGLMREVELTWENMMLGSLQGILLDADGTIIYNWFNEFGVPQAAEIDFDLDNANPAAGAVWKVCFQVIDQMKKAAKGAWGPNTYVGAFCGSRFWQDLITHPECQKAYELQAQAGSLDAARTLVGQPMRFTYGNIVFEYYLGTDDNSKVAVDPDKCKFYPVNAPGAFQIAYTPGEFFDTVNRPGQPVYSLTVPDTERQSKVEIEVYSYPLPLCTRPGMLQRAKRT